jgi:hypothetical protein
MAESKTIAAGGQAFYLPRGHGDAIDEDQFFFWVMIATAG